MSSNVHWQPSMTPINSFKNWLTTTLSPYIEESLNQGSKTPLARTTLEEEGLCQREDRFSEIYSDLNEDSDYS